jgi:hypothetical protein
VITVNIELKGAEAAIARILSGVNTLDYKAKGFMNDCAEHYSGMLLTKGIGLTCHTKKELADLGHPYSRKRHMGYAVGHEPWAIHKQTGAMQRAWNNKNLLDYPATLKGRSSATYKRRMMFDEAKDAEGYAHAVWTIFGTKSMYGRFVVRAMIKEFEPAHKRIFDKWFNNQTFWEKTTTMRIANVRGGGLKYVGY